MGNFETGTDGHVYWESTMMTGPRIKSGDERAAAIREARFNGNVYWLELYQDVHTVGADTVDSMPCYKIVLTPHQGPPETQYYDIENHLLRQSEMTLKTDMGEIPVVAFPSDYREVDGLLIPHRSRQIAMGMQEMIFVTESIEHNADIPAERFALPDEIKALIEKEAQGAQEE
jgi:hypothetical protein